MDLRDGKWKSGRPRSGIAGRLRCSTCSEHRRYATHTITLHTLPLHATFDATALTLLRHALGAHLSPHFGTHATEDNND